ncbi:MAG: hypothetical protein ACLQPD_02420 [Desulfomonilaceae bacterium]
MSQRSMAVLAKTDGSTAEMKVKSFDSPLCLLGVAWLQVPENDDGFVLKEKGLSLPVKVQVPQGTEFIHVSLLSSQQAFDSFTPCRISPLGATRYDINIVYEDGKLKKDTDNWCEFTFEAVLQDKPTIDKTGSWTGFYLLEVMCFGPKS